MRNILLYVAAILPFLWGVSHLFPTKSVVKEFGEISTDNKRIITMEWIIEGIALIFIGLLIATVTYFDPVTVVSRVVYALSIACLIALAIASLFTGFRIKFLPFRLCPIIFTASAILIYFGGLF